MKLVVIPYERVPGGRVYACEICGCERQSDLVIALRVRSVYVAGAFKLRVFCVSCIGHVIESARHAGDVIEDKRRGTMQEYRLFGDRVLVRLLYPKPERSENVNAPQIADVNYAPRAFMPPLPAGVAMAMPASRGDWSSPFGKGQVIVIGQPVEPATSGDAPFRDDDVIGETGDNERPGGLPGGLPQELSAILHNFFEAVFNVRSAPLPPLTQGDVILFQLHAASMVPETGSLFIVESSGIVGVVTELDFTREGSE